MALTAEGLQNVRRANAAFSDDIIRTIRKTDREGRMSRRMLSRFYKCSLETIARICRRDTYDWVPDVEVPDFDRFDGVHLGRGVTAAPPSAGEIEESLRRVAEGLGGGGVEKAKSVGERYLEKVSQGEDGKSVLQEEPEGGMKAGPRPMFDEG